MGKTSDQDIAFTPGSDNVSFVSPILKNVAKELSKYEGTEYKVSDVAPAEYQKVATDEIAHLVEEPSFKLDFSTAFETIKGTDNVAPSKSFLQKFLGRLRKKHPNAAIVQSGK